MNSKNVINHSKGFPILSSKYHYNLQKLNCGEFRFAKKLTKRDLP